LLKPVIKRDENDSLLTIKVKTRQISNKLILDGSQVLIHVKDPPLKGKANKTILKILSKYFKTILTLESGHTSKEKVVRLHNLIPERVQEILNV
jgi:uncharacterized protein (TIGR00251 family)